MNYDPFVHNRKKNILVGKYSYENSYFTSANQSARSIVVLSKSPTVERSGKHRGEVHRGPRWRCFQTQPCMYDDLTDNY